METANKFCTKHLLDINTTGVVNNIFKLKHLWISRSNEFPFYTLGRSAYLDGNTNDYEKDIVRMNAILESYFLHVYDEVLHVLHKTLQEPVELTGDLRYPGFHIFPSDKKLLTIAGNWHVDYPHETLGLGDEDTSTITIPILLPKSGGGIEYKVSDSVFEYLPYTEKEMIWHKGNIIHRISSFKEYVPGEYRITMQGHLVRRNGQMELYW